MNDRLQVPNSGQPLVPNPEQGAVIEAGADEWLLVVAGPGTGKTQVAAMRLVHLLELGLQPAQILVLSFSRSAVATLSKRLATLRVNDPGVMEELRHLAIRTFDSWAFRMLRQGGEVVTDLLSRSHEQNIAAVTRRLEDVADPIGERLGVIRHVIVDEFQDLPGVRAQMVASLLSRLNRVGNPSIGFTVLGDPVQAIYRFAARGDDQPVPTDPWQDLKRRMGPKLREIVLTRNHRATEKLAAAAVSLRKILGSADLDAESKLAAMQRFLGNIPASTTDSRLAPGWLAQLPEGSLAVLTRTNGEAVRVWKMLLGDGLEGPSVSVRLRLAGSTPTVPAWIAGLLSGFKHPSISRKVFELAYAKAAERLGGEAALDVGLPSADVAWRRLARASGGPESATSLDLDELRNRLTWPDSFPDDQVSEEAAVHITTIHQSKGMEFDNVALLDAPERDSDAPPDDPLEQAHVGFVAVTRAGRHLGRLPSTSIFKPPRNRAFRHGRSRLVGWGPLVNMQMGLDGDLEPTSFVSTEVHGDERRVASLQQTLLEGVSTLRGRKVVLSQVKTDGSSPRARDIRYDVRLQQQEGEGALLGRTTAQVTHDLLDLLWDQGYAMPRNIYNLRIAEVNSIGVNADPNEDIPEPWRSSRLWLGITLAGTGDFKTWKRHGK
jgi:DNA helicase II / ATP-dependent DNA helicase PcrA